MRKRQWEHLCALRRKKHHSRYLQRAWTHYRASSFVFEVLEFVSDANQLLQREQHYLDTLQPAYNMSPMAGSCRGVKHTEAMRSANSERLLGRKLTPEHCRNISRSLKGRIFSEEHRRRLSMALTGKTPSNETRERLRVSHRGIPQSAETIAKRTASLRRVWKDPVALQRRSDASLRMWANPDTRLNLVAARARGASHHKTTLDEKQVAEIKSLLREGQMRQTEIAAVYGVSRHVIWNIKHGVTWVHVP